MTDWKDSRSCGPVFVIVRLAMPPPAVVIDDVQPAELVDRGLQRLLGAGEVGDVDRVELAADALRDLLAVGTLAVEHRDLAPRSCSSSALARPMPDAPPMTTTFLPLISIRTSLSESL